MEWLQQIFAGPFGTKLACFFTEFGEELVCVAVLGFFYWGLNKEIGKYIGLNVCVNTVWNPFIKNIFLRRRPYFDNPSIKILKPVDSSADIYDIQAQGYSFPSGHSSGSGTAYWSIVRRYQKKWVRIVFFVLPILVGVSRFILGAHYPTDVFAGWLLAVAIIFMVPALKKVVKKDWILYVVLLVIGLPGFFFCTTNDFYSGYGMLLGVSLGFMFEEKWVNFENASNIPMCILRTIIGGAIFMGLNTVLKLPFSKEVLEAQAFSSYMIRTIRYAIVTFVAVGVYPMSFKMVAKNRKKDK